MPNFPVHGHMWSKSFLESSHLCIPVEQIEAQDASNTHTNPHWRRHHMEVDSKDVHRVAITLGAAAAVTTLHTSMTRPQGTRSSQGQQRFRSLSRRRCGCHGIVGLGNVGGVRMVFALIDMFGPRVAVGLWYVGGVVVVDLVVVWKVRTVQLRYGKHVLCRHNWPTTQCIIHTTQST